MSAWQVRGSHIAVMVDAAIMLSARHNFGQNPDTSERSKLMAMLAEENAKSVNHRYAGPEEKPSPAVTNFPAFNQKVLTLHPMMVLLKAIDCYEYQASEHEGWKDSEARKFCARLRKQVYQNAPEYQNCAGWGL